MNDVLGRGLRFNTFIDWGDPVGPISQDKIPLKKSFDSENVSPAKAQAFNRSDIPEYNEDMLHLPIFEDRYSKKPFTTIAIDSPDRLVDALQCLSSTWRSPDKHGSHLISPSYFVEREGVSTSRAIENVAYCYGIWLDCDDGRELTPEALAAIFPRLRIVAYSTFSSTPEHPKWRAFIPTSHKVSVPIYHALHVQIIKSLNEAGYWHQDQLAKNPRIKVRRTHGLDASKYNPAQLFYLPSCKADGSAGDFLDFNEAPLRGPLRVDRWLINAIHDVAPNEVLREDEIIPLGMIRLKALRTALVTSTSSYCGVDQRKVDQALVEWQMTPRGQGNAGFFKFAVQLQVAGMAVEDIRTMLSDHYSDSSSKAADRKAQIRSIIANLKKRGSRSGIHGNAKPRS